MSSKSRIVYFEVMRVIACFFVIFDHITVFNCGTVSTLNECFNLFWFIFCKFSVPLFFMISGTLLLRKELTIKQIFSNIIRIMIVLSIFSFLYYVISVSNKHKPIVLGDFIRQLYSSCSSYNSSFWFLYVYIGFLVVIPFLKLIVNNMTNMHFRYLILIMLFFNALYIFEYFMSKGNIIPNQYILQGTVTFRWIVYEAIFYPIVGYYLDNKVSIEKVGKKLPLLWALSFSTIIISLILTNIEINVLNINNTWYLTFRNTFTYVTTIAIFLTIKYICCVKIHLPKKLEKIFIELGSCTFGIYLIHWAVLTYMTDFLVCDTISYSFFISIIEFIVCYLAVRLLKFIPIVNKYI